MPTLEPKRVEQRLDHDRVDGLNRAADQEVARVEVERGRPGRDALLGRVRGARVQRVGEDEVPELPEVVALIGTGRPATVAVAVTTAACVAACTVVRLGDTTQFASVNQPCACPPTTRTDTDPTLPPRMFSRLVVTVRSTCDVVTWGVPVAAPAGPKYIRGASISVSEPVALPTRATPRLIDGIDTALVPLATAADPVSSWKRLKRLAMAASS